MKKSKFMDEQIVASLSDAEAATLVATECKYGFAEQTLYRRRQRFAGMEVSDVRELKPLEEEISRLKSYWLSGIWKSTRLQ
jgi:putative transposase